MENAKHTPGPWRTNGQEIVQPRPNNAPMSIATCSFSAENKPICGANAAFIVRACNSHEAMLEALLLVNENNDGVLTLDAIQAVRAAIAQAEDK